METISLQRVPTCLEAEVIIKRLVLKGRLCWSSHSKKRMEERGITIPQILNCLSKGRVVEEPFLNYSNGGGYEMAMEKITAGELLRVVVCIKFSKNLLIVTVY